ncbi:hypothetical protein AB205_0014330 [Aquarana catesbeiana]|uniref:Uncharacterized protein n=1 Tax=Aquarana catesbeiana TaxID=8400 RepID=A0A2G9RNR8_AQUCT|nr:hypothetical protein AB205_0014330 [Aquarana catesbeiana]
MTGDEDYRTQETDLRHRKSDPGGRRDLEHKITEDVDIVLHTTAEVTRSNEIKVIESTESKNIVVIPHNVQSIVNQEQVNPPDLLELKKKVLIGCEIKVSQYEEELTSRVENLEDNEPSGNSEHKVYKGGQHTGEPSSDGQYEESLFQPITLQSLSFEDQKQLVGTTGQEEEEKIKSLIEITTEKWEYSIATEQEAQVLEESIDSTVTLEFDVDTILDVIENNKKLVTPVDEPESSSSQGGDSRKTLEDLLETANRLAKHCDLFQKVEDQKGSDNLRDLDETLGSMPASILSTDLGYTEENLTSVDVSLTKSNFFLEQNENKQTNLEEETIKTQSLVFGQSNRNFEEEGKEVSAKDLSKPTNKEDVQGIEGHLTEKQEEKHQFKESERQPNISKKQKIKRRVHFSPSTEDLFKKSERASRNTLQMVCDEILEGELQPGEDREQLGSSYIIKDLGESPSKEREGNYLGGTTCSYDSHYDGQSTSEEEETNGLNEGQTVWYDEYPAQAEHGERCDSLGAVTDQNVHVDFKMEESFATATDSRSKEEHLDHIPSSEETLSFETESAGNRDKSNINNVNLEQTLFTENKNESHALRETVNKSEKESLAASDGTEETVRKEDSFLEEEKYQVEYLLEDRKDLLECDPTHVKESIDDIRQSSDTLDTKNVGVPKDFTDEQKQTDILFLEQAILGQDYPTEDTDNKQLQNIIHYSAHRDITETASAENDLTLVQCSILKTDKIIKSEQDGKEVQDETFLSDAKDVLKSFEEQTRSGIVQFEEDTLLRQPVSRNGDDGYPENLHGTQLSTSVDEICMSLVGDVELRDGPPSEEHKEVFRDANFEGESEHNNKTSTNEMEEQPEHMTEKQSYDYKHEDFPPETSKPQEEEDSNVKTGHIGVELLTEQQWVAEEQYGSGNEASLTEGHFTEQMQDGNSFRQLAPTDGSEECPEESYETDQSASLNEETLKKEDQVSEEFNDIFKDVNLTGESESIKELMTHEVQEHTVIIQNDDYIHEHSQPNAGESQEEDIQVSCNDQFQEGKLQGQPVFTDSDEVCHKELVETEQGTSIIEMYTSIVGHIPKEEGQVSEEFNDILKDVSFRAESESMKEIIIHEVQEHTSIIQNNDYIHEHFQSDTRKSQDEDIQVRIGHIEEDILSEEQLVDHKEDSLIEVSCNDQLQVGRLQGQPVFRDSDEVCHEELVQTEQGTSVIEICTSTVEHISQGEGQVSEEFNDIFKDVNFGAESESIKELMTPEVQEHTSIIQHDDYIHEHFQPNAGESQEEDIQVRVGHIEEDIFSEEQLVVHKEDSLIEVSCNDQLQEGKLQGQPVFRDGDEVCHKKLVETEQGISVIEMHTSIVQHIPKGEDHVSEEFNDNLKDVNFRAEGESIKEIMTHEVQEHTSIIQNDEHINELFQPDARESQEEDIQISIPHIEDEILNEEKFAAEEQLVVHKEDSLIEVSSNDQLQEDRLQGQPVFRDIDEVYRKEPLETEQSTSVIEMCTSIVEDILERENNVSEEFNVNFRAESESFQEMMTYEVQEHTSIIKNDGYVHEHFQPDATESQEEDTQVRTDHTEVEFLTEEQFVLKDKVCSAEGTRNDQHYEDRLISQPVPGESNEKLHETELSKLTGEICTSIAEGVLIENSLVSEEERDVFREVSLITEGEPHSATSTCELDELQQYTDEEQNDNSIYEDSSKKTRKSQGDDSEVSSGHLEVEHLTKEQLVDEGQFKIDNDASAKDHLQEDRLLEKTVFRGRNEVSHDILHVTEPRTTVNEICTSIVNDVLRDSLVSEESRESFSEVGLKEESISHSDTSTYEVKELQDHTAEEQNNDYIREVSLIETRKSQEDDSEGNTDHLEAENVTEEPFVTEEQFKVDNEASPIKGSSTGDQLQEDRLLGQSDYRDSDDLCNKELFETVQSISVIETLTSVVEDVLITEGLVSEQCSEVIKDADFKTESISLNETTTYEIQEQRYEKQNNDYTHEEIQLDAKESQEEVNRVKIDHIEKEQLVAEQQLVITNEGSTTEGSQEEDSKVKIGHIEVEFLCEEQLVAEEQLVVHNEGSLTAVSCNDQLQEDRLQEQPIARYIDEVRHQELYETEQNTSMVEMCPLIVEDDLIRADLVSEEFSGISKDVNFTSECESHNESITCEVQANMAVKQNSEYTYIDLQQDASELQVEDSKEKIGHVEVEFLTGEQFVVTDKPCPAEGSSNDQLKEELLREPVSRDSDNLWPKELYETELSALENEICTSFSEDVQIRDVIGSEDRTEVLTEAGLLQESKSYRATSMCEVEEQQEHTAGENNDDHIFEVSLTETSKSQGNDNEVNAVCLEAENITKEQLVSETQFEVPNETSQIEGSSTDQLQEDGLLQTISKESDEINYKDLDGTEQSASVIKLCISIADDILRDSLESEELSGIIKDTHFQAASESHNETTTCEIQEQSGERKDNDYTHEDFKPETNESNEDGKFKAGHREAEYLTEEQFVVTVEAYQVEKSSNDQMQEDKLSEEHRDFFKEVSLKTENQSDSKISTCEVEDLQEHTTEEHNDKNLCEDFQIETSKSQEDSKAKIAPTEVEFEPKEQFVVEEQFVLKNAFLTDEDKDHTEEKHDFSNNTNKEYIKVIEEYEPQLEQDNKELLKESYEDEGFSHQAINAVAQNTSTGHTIVLDTTAEQENQLDKIFQSHEKELDLLSDINSTIYSSLLDQSISVSSDGTDATLDTQKMESVLYDSHITASNLDSVLEVTELADFEVENNSKAPKELDLLSEIQYMLSPDHTVRRFPEIVDDLNGKVTVSSEDQLSAYGEEQASEISKDLDSSSGSLLEGPTDNWRSTSDSNDETGKDLLLEIQSVITADLDIKTANFSSSIKLVESDVRVEEEEDEKASHLTSGNSVYATEEYVRLETSTVEEEVDNEQKVISIENLGFTHEPSQVEGDVSQQDSVFGTVVINTSALEEAVNVDIINTSANGENSLTRELCGPEIDIKSQTQTGLIQVDINKVQSSTNEETTTIYLNEVEYENREHSIKEEYLPIKQTSCHADITRGQEQTLVDEMEMSNEPAVQEEDDLDTKVPFHSILDVSAQKSRILLLRKTSVRRRPGQRLVMFQEELADPSVIPPLNMGVTPDPESSYPTEEATEMSNTSEPLLHRKSSIRRRGQHQPTFQEELAGSSALPPLNMGMSPAPESSYPSEEATEMSDASEPLLRRKSTIRRRGPRPVTFQEEPSLPLITSAESPHPTEEPRNDSTISEQILLGESSIHQHQGQHRVAFEDEPVKSIPPVIMPLKMGVPHFLGGIPILSPAVAPKPELLHPAEEPRDEGTTSEPMLRRKSSVRRPKGKQEQPIEPPQREAGAHMTPAPAPSHHEGESREEKKASEELIKPKKGFLKHAGFGGAHPGMMQELQARLHKKKPKE